MIKSKNGTFFSKTKKVFKSKPARIIFALLIIGGIMTAVSFAVIFLMKKLKQKCTDKPGMTWNDDLQMCVQRDCANLSGKNSDAPGVCRPDDYCTSKGENVDGLPYVFDPESGECTIVCSNDELIPVTSDGKSYINQADINKENPDNHKDITCQSPCQYAGADEKQTRKGGPGFCYTSGKYMYRNPLACGETQILSGETPTFSGCLETNFYQECGTSDFYCKNQESCVEDGKGNYTCTTKKCTGSNQEGQELFYMCKSNEECNHPSAKCVKDEGKFKFFQGWGYCDNNNNDYIPAKCMSKEQVALQNITGDYDISPCEKGIGVNSELQCPISADFWDDQKLCSKHGLCANDWQASSSEISCISKPEFSNAKDVLKYIKSNPDMCCGDENKATDPTSGKKFCCPIPAIPDKGTKRCTNNTTYGYSKKFFYNHTSPEYRSRPDVLMDCSTDEDCPVDKLWKNLGNTNDYPSDRSSWGESGYEYDKYVDMNCDIKLGKTKGVCKANCGYFDGLSRKHARLNVINQVSDSEYNIGPYSYCSQKNSDCQAITPTYEKIKKYSSTEYAKYIPDTTIPICYKENGSTDGYWGGAKDKGYMTNIKVSIANGEQKSCGASDLDTFCRNYAGNNEFITDITVDPDNEGCIAPVPCDKLEFNIGGSHSSSGNNIKWTELTNLDSLTEFDTSGTFNNKILYKPQPSSAPSPYRIHDIHTPYDPDNECKGSGHRVSNPKFMKSPLKETNINTCTTTVQPSTLLNQTGEYCNFGYNPLTGECNLKTNLTNNKETFINYNTNEKNNLEDDYPIDMSGMTYVKFEGNSTGEIVDINKNNYYCEYAGLTNQQYTTLQQAGRSKLAREQATNTVVYCDHTSGTSKVTCYPNSTSSVNIGCCNTQNSGRIYYDRDDSHAIKCVNPKSLSNTWNYDSFHNKCTIESNTNGKPTEHQCLQDNLEPRTTNFYGQNFITSLIEQQKNMPNLADVQQGGISTIDKMHNLLVVLTSTVFTDDKASSYTMPLTVYNNVFGGTTVQGEDPTMSQVVNGSIGLTGFIGNNNTDSGGIIKQCKNADDKINSMNLNVIDAQTWGVNGSQWKLYSYNKFGITNVNGISYQDCFALQAIDNSQDHSYHGYQGLLTAYTNQGSGIDKYSVGFLWNKVLWYVDKKDEDPEIILKYAQTAIQNDPMAYAFKFDKDKHTITKLFYNKVTKYAVIRPRHIANNNDMANIYGIGGGTDGIFPEPACRTNWNNLYPLFYPATLFLEDETDSTKNFPCNGGNWPGSFEESYKSDFSLNNIFVLGVSNQQSAQGITNLFKGHNWPYSPMPNNFANLCCNSDNPSPVEFNSTSKSGLNDQFCFAPYKWNIYDNSIVSINKNVSTCEIASTAEFMNKPIPLPPPPPPPPS